MIGPKTLVSSAGRKLIFDFVKDTKAGDGPDWLQIMAIRSDNSSIKEIRMPMEHAIQLEIFIRRARRTK